MAKKSYGVIADGIGEFVTIPLKQGMLCGRRPYSRFLSLGSAKKNSNSCIFESTKIGCRTGLILYEQIASIFFGPELCVRR